MKYKLLIIGAFTLIFFYFSHPVKAQYIENAKFSIVIDINEDSTFDITEEITNTWTGLVHGHRRYVPLSDSGKCANANGKACVESIDRIMSLGAFDGDGDKLKDPDFRTYVEYQGGVKNFVFEWEIWSDGKNLSSDDITWTVKYKVFGGIVWEGHTPYFYWNIIPSDRGGNTEYANIKINFPDSIKFDRSKFKTYNDYLFEDQIRFKDNSVEIKLNDLPQFGDYTVEYEFLPTDLEKPGSLEYKVSKPISGVSVYLDGELFSENLNDQIRSFPSGDHTLTFKHFGYKEKSFNLNIGPNEKETLDVKLSPTTWMQVLIYLGYLTMLLGCLLTPLAPILVYIQYLRRGRDRNKQKTIVPLFNPPEGIRPYLLGSIKDEKVDRVDIVGSIIDLAYRGYIKIKELKKGKNYELTKLQGKPNDIGLNSIELEILNALFSSSNIVETKNLRTTFPLKYKQIETNIYNEMINKGYFKTSPVAVRGTYLGISILLFIIGIISIIFGTITGSAFMGILFFCTPGFFFTGLGVAYFVASFYMPFKTEKGSKVYGEILGFKMYLNTAERYRLQNLKPEYFEKFLSFAIVFGIEKQWADKFKNINLSAPDWYEGSDNLTDAILISIFVRSFTTSTVTNFTPVSSGSSSGGGSFSGSFGGGGFSGGGGGGGGSGGW